MKIKSLISKEQIESLKSTYESILSKSNVRNLEETEDLKKIAQQLDYVDPFSQFRNKFNIPKQANGEDEIYLCGNSLGLQPRLAQDYVIEELQSWQKRGVKGHFRGDYPWLPYHELLAKQAAELVGARENEVVVMNSLTVNLHLMMVSFFQPEGDKSKILLEDHAFPSDHYAVESQLKLHKLDPAENMLLMKPRAGTELLDKEEILNILENQGNEIALVLLPGIQYYTGQFIDIKGITEVAHQKNIVVGVDLAHAVGNVPLELHDWGVDFAVWCSYKYINSGPGAVGGCFVNEKHGKDAGIPRLAGWWGHDKETRFKMENNFSAIPTAEGWQLSNPPILSLAAIRASFDTFSLAGGVRSLREKSVLLTGFLELILDIRLKNQINIITPGNPAERGAQLSLSVNLGRNSYDKKIGREVYEEIEARGVTADWREPNVIRIAPTPLYNSFSDVCRFVDILEKALNEN
jgi:kynureninase